MMDCTVIVPVYYNEGSITTTFNKVKTVLDSNTYSNAYEFIFVDDGSADGSYTELQQLRAEYPSLVRLIKFTRNFGQVAAMKAGYMHARGRCVINISADLQDPPALINDMLNYYFEEKYEVVICTRQDREESWFRKKTSLFFYKTMQKLTFKNMPLGGFDFALLSRKVIDAFIHNHEANPFWQGQVLWTGYKIKFIPYQRLKREIGKSRWTFGKKIKYLIDGVLAYSYFPLRFMTGLGIVLFLAGLIYAIIIVLSYFIGNVPFKGWAPIMILVLILSGIQMLMLGIIGEYLWRTLDQVRDRPQFIIESIEE